MGPIRSDHFNTFISSAVCAVSRTSNFNFQRLNALSWCSFLDEEARSGHVHADEGSLDDAVGPVPIVARHLLDPRLQQDRWDSRKDASTVAQVLALIRLNPWGLVDVEYTLYCLTNWYGILSCLSHLASHTYQVISSNLWWIRSAVQSCQLFTFNFLMQCQDWSLFLQQVSTVGHPWWPPAAICVALQRPEEDLWEVGQHPVLERHPTGTHAWQRWWSAC